MYFLEIMSFRELAVTLIGELNPAMYFLYDLLAVVLCFLFLMIIYGFFAGFFRKISRW